MMSKDPLTPEQIDIYRAVLLEYTKGDPVAMKLASRTEPYRIDSTVSDNCFRDVPRPANVEHPLVHRMDPGVALSDRMHLVNAGQQGPTINEEEISNHGRAGAPLPKAGEPTAQPIATELFTFSEIIFNKDHTRALVQYEYYCGGMCGDGGSMILQKEGGQWSLRGRCSYWIS